MAIPSYPTFISLSLDVILALPLELCRFCMAEVWVCVLQSFHVAQEAAGPKGAAVRWEGAGVQLTTGRDKQQLLEQAGLSLDFPFCHCKPLVRLSKNYLVSACARGLWCCRLSSSSQGAKCPRDPLQDWLCSGGQAGLKGRGEPCSASDTPSCEHHPRLQAEISS